MNFFNYKDGQLYAEDVSVQQIVKKVGTPVYVYSYKTFQRHFKVFDGAFKSFPHITCYSCKANSNGALLRMVAKMGGGADVVSGGELFRALRVSIPAHKIVFSGVGKTEAEIRYAIQSRILMINMESADEVRTVAKIARRMRTEVAVSIRVNPEIDPKTHPYITTGLKKNKFGILWEEARRLYREIADEPFLVPVGISSHIGSQITEMGPFIEAVQSLKGMVRELRREGIGLKYIDIGGGLGIQYKGELPPHPDEYGPAIERELRGSGLTLILEPGRVIVGNSGIFVTKILYVKKTPEKRFYIVDGAMNDLVRPALYEAYHEIMPLEQADRKKERVDVVGPICESGDFLARDRKMPMLPPGAVVAVFGAGAYGFSMSSNYNSRRRVPEVLVRGKEFFVVRRRDSLNDLVRGEIIPEFLKR
ncbi:MAG TPA: diaminopimelate decarboxylase [Syntrophorhabdales bacterium]|nr:diaminopimelate decarboxylase [Syntrophorhabdales bacterium]